jgi:hypothetical protein
VQKSFGLCSLEDEDKDEKIIFRSILQSQLENGYNVE